MTNKHCLVYETLGKVSNLTIMEGTGDGLMRLEGVFGVCGVKNQNNRVYDKDNYRQMVESLQQVIQETGCPGELEHPNSMNINLENVSHKIESIQMNEDGTITGTIVLLNTPKGQIAQAIIEGGLPLFISSRGAGTITNEGRVTLSTIKTYDLVGTPGFSQAKLTLKENQTLECLNESLEEGNVMYAIVDESEEDDDKGDKDEKDNKTNDDNIDPKDDKDDKGDKDEKDNKDEKNDKKEDKKEDDKDNKNNDKVDMKDLKEAIDKLSDKVTSLEAQLHVAQESLNETKSQIPTVNYDAIQQWVSEEFANDFKETILGELNTKIDELTKSVTESVDEKINTVNESVDEKVNNAIVTIAEGVQNWVTEEFAPEVQNWVVEEFAPEIQNWVVEEFAPEVDNWINEEFAPEHMQNVENKVNENVSAFLAENKAGRLEEIDSLLESIADNTGKDLENIVKENSDETNKFKGVYVVENMPAEFKPSWEMLNEERQREIIRSSRIYDFTKEGVLESFWANVKFDDKQQAINENKDNVNNPINDYHKRIATQMVHLRNANF